MEMNPNAISKNVKVMNGIVKVLEENDCSVKEAEEYLEAVRDNITIYSTVKAPVI